MTAGTISAIVKKVGTEPRYRDDQRADMWVGKPIAEELKLSLPKDKKTVSNAINTLKEQGILKTVPGLTGKREEKMFVVAVEGTSDKVSASVNGLGQGGEHGEEHRNA